MENYLIQFHLFTMIPAVFIGLLILFLTKGTLLHKTLGRFWAFLMLLSAALSFGIKHHGNFSWIHILSVVVIVSVIMAIVSIRRGNRAAHQGYMVGSFVGSLVAGFFAVVGEGRYLHQLLFS